MIEPGKDPYIMEMPNTLKEMQSLVGGYIETIALKDGFVIVCNADGKPLNLPPNRWNGINMIFGTFFICRQKGGKFTSLKSGMMDYWTARFKLNRRVK